MLDTGEDETAGTNEDVTKELPLHSICFVISYLCIFLINMFIVDFKTYYSTGAEPQDKYLSVVYCCLLSVVYFCLLSVVVCCLSPVVCCCMFVCLFDLYLTISVIVI